MIFGLDPLATGPMMAGGPVLPAEARKEAIMPKELVRLRIRPSRDGDTFVFMLDYVDENGTRRRASLGHADKRKAEWQRAQKERELRMGVVAPNSMRLREFMENSLARTGDQIRESTRREYRIDMDDFIRSVGNIDMEAVTSSHGESFRQECLDRGNSPATVAKKLRHVKRFFQLAVERGQLDRNPLRFVKCPRVAKAKVRVYSDSECTELLRAAGQFLSPVNWELLILTALTTGMRRSELLNATWRDVNFAEMTIEVAPKDDADEIWAWQIKDAERRMLPLTDELTTMLAEHQSRQPEGHPYVFIPPERYAHIQELRKQGQWTYTGSRLKVLNNFRRDFLDLLKQAGIRAGTFHDLRRTCLSKWLANGMSEHDVMVLAGHSSFATTHTFYLAVRKDLVNRARQCAGFWRALGARPDFRPQDVDNRTGKLLNSKDLDNRRP